MTIALEAHVARLQASVATIAHHERPDYLDRLAVLRDQVFVLDHMYMSLFSTCGWILRLGVTVALLVSIHPALVLLARVRAADGADLDVAAGGRARAPRSAARRPSRLARHLFTIATTAPPGKEVRVTGIGERLVAERRAAWERWYGPVAAARWGSARCGTRWPGRSSGAPTSARSCSWPSGSRAPPGDVLLVLAAGARLSAYIGATVGEIGFLRGIWMDGSRRLAWLEDYAAVAGRRTPTCRCPTRLRERHPLRARLVRLPGHRRGWCSTTSTSTLPAGAVVAIVGENGAGKTTLVKLLAKLYEPTVGRDPRRRRGRWRACPPTSGATRLAGAFQDFFRFEFRARHTVGVGDVPRLDDEPAVVAAVGRAGADDVVARLAAGLDTQLGPTWPDGVEVSFGQWQKLALARGFMRDEPLLLVLDEPTAALDAETEHALFERYAAARAPRRRGDDDGRITILVSHRFSTVRMADLIVVLDGARVVEVGTHEELMARGGQYAELYGIQAAAYR